MAIKRASGVVRIRKGDYSLNDIRGYVATFGKYAILTNQGISFYSEPIHGLQEYLVSQYKVRSGILVVKLSELVYEISFVKNSFIESYKIITLESTDYSRSENFTKICDLISVFVNENSNCKIVLNTENDLFNENLSLALNNLIPLIVDKTEDIPEKYVYRLAITLNTSQSSTRVVLIVSILLAITVGIFLLNKFWPDAEVVDDKGVVIVDPYLEYYSVLYGELPSARQQLWLAYEVISNIQRLPERKMQTLTFTQKPDRRSMQISSVLVPVTDDAKPDLTSLIQRVNTFDGGYMLDIQQQYPILFTERPNIGAYDQSSEAANSDPISRKEWNVGIYNIDKTIAYLTDAINAVVPNARVLIPPATESARVSNGYYQQREFNINFEGNYKEHLDYLSIIFAGWPVVFISGQLTGVDSEGRFTGQISLTILGDTM